MPRSLAHYQIQISGWFIHRSGQGLPDQGKSENISTKKIGGGEKAEEGMK